MNAVFRILRRQSLPAAAITLASVLAGINPASAQVSQDTLKSLSAPDSIDTRVGTLEFKDGVPSAETAQLVYDTLDFTRALNVYNNSFRGASALAIVKGFEEVGAKPGDVVIFSELMDSSSLFLTANADTVYYLTGLDLSKGPVVVEQPSNGRRHDQRHVVFLGNRHRRPRAGPWSRRQIPDRWPWL